MKDTEKIEDLTQAYETFFMLFKNKLSFQESDNFEILLQRLQHRFGNPDAGCIDVENAQSLERMLPDAISILEDLYDDL